MVTRRSHPRLITLRRPAPRLLTPCRGLQSAALAFLSELSGGSVPVRCRHLHPATLHQPDGDPVADNQLGGGEVVHGSGYVPPRPAPNDPSDVARGEPVPLGQLSPGRPCRGLIPEPANVGIAKHRSPVAGALAGRAPTPDTRKRPRNSAAAFIGLDGSGELAAVLAPQPAALAFRVQLGVHHAGGAVAPSAGEHQPRLA